LTDVGSGRKSEDGRHTGHAGYAGGHMSNEAATRFVVQLHDATTLHFDLRI
jgi:hypothetical protein